MATIGEILVRLGLDVSDFEKKLKNTAKSFKETGEQLQKIGTSLSIGITAPLTAIGGLSIKAALDNERAGRIFRATFGDMADAAQEWVTNFNKAIQDNESNIQELLGRFNILFTNFGIGRESALQMAEGMTKLAYDMSSFMAIPVESAFEKIRGAMMGMSRGVKELGIDIEDTTLKEEALRRGIIKEKQELSEAQKVVLRYALLIEKTGFMHDATGKMAETAEGKFRSFKAKTGELAETFGAILIPALDQVLEVMLDLTKKAQDILTWFNNLPAPIKNTALAIGGLVVVTGPLLAGLGMAIKLFGELQNSLVRVIPALKNASTQFMATTAAASALGGALALGSHMWVEYESSQISAIHGQMEATKTISELSRAIGKGHSEEREALKELKREYDDFDELLKAIARGEGGEKLKKLLEDIKDKSKGASEKTQTLEQSIKDLFGTLKETKKKAEEVKIPDPLEAFEEQEIEMKLEWYRKKYGSTMKNIYEEAEELSQSIGSVVSGILAEDEDKWRAHMLKIAEAWEKELEEQRKAKEAWLNYVSEIGGIIAGGLTSITGTILSSFAQWGEASKSTSELLKDIWKSARDAVVRALMDMAMTSMRAAIQNIASSKAAAIASALRSVFAKIPFPASLALAGAAIAAVSALFSRIRLAEGGLVTMPALATIAERGPEVVIPLEKLKMFEGRRTPPVVNVYFNNYSPISSNMDIDKIAERLGTKVSIAIMNRRR